MRRHSVTSTAIRILLLALALCAGPAYAQVDTDSDGISDASDGCPSNVNPHQEDSDADGVDDVCDRDTLNALLEADRSGALHVRTPSYQLKYAPATQLQLSPEGGIGAAAMPSLGLYPPDPIIGFGPNAISGLTTAYVWTTPTLVQSTWQTAVAASVFSPQNGPALDLHLSSYANGVGLGYEIPLALVQSMSDVEIEHGLALPVGWTLDTSEATAGGGVGRLTVSDPSGTAKFRISPVELLAFGSRTTLADSPTFFGLSRLSDELEATAGTARVGPPDLVGSNFSGGIHAPLVQTSYTLEDNMAEGALGATTATSIRGGYLITVRAPRSFIERSRATSSRIFVGLRISSLVPVDLGVGSPGAPAPTVHGRHLVFFDDEAVITGSHVDVELNNVFSTFDGTPPDYALFPNDGGSAALHDAASQQQTGLGCSGCTIALQGDSSIAFENGGVGVGIAPGPRVAPAHPCIATDPLHLTLGTGRCAAGKNKRAVFSADKLSITGSMSGLVAAESDVTLDEFVFVQQPDRNVTEPTLLHGVLGLGCAGDAGPRIGVNPSNGDVTGNVPFDLDGGPCTAAQIGQGTCIPPALATPATTGLCNLVVKRVELIGMAAAANPLGTDLTLPAGEGIALHMRQGVGQIGDLAYAAGAAECVGTLESQPSSVIGFETLASFSGGANVRDGSAEPIAADDQAAVPPNTYCITNVLGDELGMGLVVVGNVDVHARHLQIERTLAGALHVANGAANVENLASTQAQGPACRSLDASTCATPAQELACPDCALGRNYALAISSSGKSAPTRLSVRDSVLGLDEDGPSSGGNPALPPLVVDGNLQAVGGGLTIGRRLAGLLRPPVQISLGPDTMNDASLFSLSILDSNIGVGAAAVSIDNFDSAGGKLNVTLADNCYSPDATTCLVTGASLPVLASATAASGVQTLNAQSLSDARSSPNEDAGLFFVPEPSQIALLCGGIALLGALGSRRDRRDRRARRHGAQDR